MSTLESLMEPHIKKGSIDCSQCFVLAKKSDTALKDVGTFCNKHDIKIKNCQLGCFQ